MRLLRSELAFPGKLEKAESGERGLIDRVDPVALVSARRSNPYWLPWRFRQASWVRRISESRSASAESMSGQSILSDLDKREDSDAEMAEVMSGFII